MANEQNQTPASLGDPATEPIDLAQAFKMYNQANAATTDSTVEVGEASQETEPSDSGEGQQTGEPAPEGNQEDSSAVTGDAGSQGTGDLGGSTDVVEPIDFNSRRQEILREIQNQSISDVRKDFSDNKIIPCSIEDLYQRDEQTGMVSFKNPDNPRQDFSSRAEAQAWVDAFNKQIDSRFRQEINKRQRELLEEYAPKLRLIEFAPKFEKLDQQTKDVMDDLLTPYAVRDKRGDIIGFNVNLDAVAAQAQRIASRFAKSSANNTVPVSNDKEASPANNGRPAMNMPTGASSNASEVEPKTIGEALKMYDEQQRQKRSKK